jgi:sulfoxide reductase heme-binding subunit YedZ
MFAGAPRPAAIDRRIVRQLVHRSLALLGLLTLAAHIVMTVLDTYVSTPWSVIVVPFTSSYEPFAIGLGSLALVGFVIAAVSGWLRVALGSMLRDRGWRVVHRTSYAAWALSLGHGLLAGPDTRQPWALAVYGVAVGFVAAAVVGRAVGARRLPQREDAILRAPQRIAANRR